MLNLTAAQTEQLLTWLNQPAQLDAWRALLAGEEVTRHLARQDEAADTDGAQWRRDLVDWMNVQVKQVARDLAQATLLGSWLACEDAFVIAPAASKAKLDPWLRAQAARGALGAVRVADSILWLGPAKRARWQARRVDHDAEPLLRLPYQRKYDRERHGRADARLRERALRICVADDLLMVLAERMGEQSTGARFAWPPALDGIRAELHSLDLDFGVDALSGMAGGLRVELIACPRDAGDNPRYEATVAEGAYAGMLGGYHRLASGALRRPLHARSLHYMATRALNDLRAQLADLIEAFGDSEPEA
jgi:hypothetical protein